LRIIRINTNKKEGGKDDGKVNSSAPMAEEEDNTNKVKREKKNWNQNENGKM
jgi:hypothetical protein